jgi:hypothetical protein
MNEYYQPEAIDYREPWMDIEGEEEDIIDNEYREASQHFLRIMTLSLGYILTSNDTLAATYAVCFTLGLAEVLDGKSMSQICEELQISRATISAHVKNIRLLTGLPPSSLMLDLDKVDTYRDSRLKNL